MTDKPTGKNTKLHGAVKKPKLTLMKKDGSRSGPITDEGKLLKNLINAVIDLAVFRIKFLGIEETTAMVTAMSLATLSSTSSEANGQERELMFRILAMGLLERGYELDDMLRAVVQSGVQIAEAQKLAEAEKEKEKEKGEDNGEPERPTDTVSTER